MKAETPAAWSRSCLLHLPTCYPAKSEDCHLADSMPQLRQPLREQTVPQASSEQLL
eukprot:CAMPEP_0115257230 /NCGR_PEP_ID=MMETSP0270-20121206/46661_1 /TAXON_ID=71861 /ORGANISM="Scrippsiella trochoidea, Strain CCMP3099" /LENGTH=55 /DNA_ID=CAMNT_0002672921 /DNA_START=190 /DNA_END=357 /DNA_ORIENTATION=-